MKKLMHINNFVWLAVFITVACSILLIIFILNQKIESSFSATVTVSEYDRKILLINPETIYKIHVGQNISLRIEQEIFTSTIKSIFYDDMLKSFALKISDVNIELLPRSSIEISLIYETHRIIDTILSGIIL